MERFLEGLGDAWAQVAAFILQIIGFLLLLAIGYIVAKVVAKIIDKVLERVGFDRAVERGGVGRALSQSKYDASSLVSKIVFYAIMLFVLQLAFGIWPANPVSDLIQGLISYLPKIFAALLIIVVGAAIAAAVKEILEAALDGLGYGRALAFVASGAILFITAFAALDQLQIANGVFNAVFYAVLAIVAGSAIVAIGGGGIPVMRDYWQRLAARADEEAGTIRSQTQGASARIRERAAERSQQVRGGPSAERGTGSVSAEDDSVIRGAGR